MSIFLYLIVSYSIINIGDAVCPRTNCSNSCHIMFTTHLGYVVKNVKIPLFSYYIIVRAFGDKVIDVKTHNILKYVKIVNTVLFFTEL